MADPRRLSNISNEEGVLDFVNAKKPISNYYVDGKLGRLLNEAYPTTDISKLFTSAGTKLLELIKRKESKLNAILNGSKDNDTIEYEIINSNQNPLDAFEVLKRKVGKQSICTLDKNNNIILSAWVKEYLGENEKLHDALQYYIKLILETSFSAIYNPDGTMRTDLTNYLVEHYGKKSENFIKEATEKYTIDVFNTQLMGSASCYLQDESITPYTIEDVANQTHYAFLLSSISNNLREKNENSNSIFDSYRLNKLADITAKKSHDALSVEIANLEVAIKDYKKQFFLSPTKLSVVQSLLTSLKQKQDFEELFSNMNNKIELITNIQKTIQALTENNQPLFKEMQKYWEELEFVKIPSFLGKKEKSKKHDERAKTVDERKKPDDDNPTSSKYRKSD